MFSFPGVFFCVDYRGQVRCADNAERVPAPATLGLLFAGELVTAVESATEIKLTIVVGYLSTVNLCYIIDANISILVNKTSPILISVALGSSISPTWQSSKTKEEAEGAIGADRSH